MRTWDRRPLQGLYNPDRIRQPLYRNEAGELTSAVVAGGGGDAGSNACKKSEQRAKRTRSHFSPDSSRTAYIGWPRSGLRSLGSSRLMTHEPFGFEALRQANQVCFQQASIPTHDLAKARFLLGLGTDFLETWRSPTRYAVAFSQMRNATASGKFVQVESRMSLTGANADEWIAIKPGREAFLTLGLAHLILPNSTVPAEEKARLSQLLEPYSPDRVASVTEVSAETSRRLAREFVSHGPSLALGGGIAASSRQETASLIAVNLLNYIAGNIGKDRPFLRGPRAAASQLVCGPTISD